jgi:hypothetical protein
MARQMAEQFYQAWLQVTRVSGKLVPQLVQGWVNDPVGDLKGIQRRIQS